MRIGIGFEEASDPFAAGQGIAREAIAKGDITDPDYVIAFCNDAVDADRFFAGLTSVVGRDAAIVGGSAIGIITNDTICSEGHPACAAVVQSEQIDFKVAYADGMDQDPEAAGAALSDQLSPREDEKLVLVFYDSIRSPATSTAPPVMNPSGPLIDGVSRNQGSEGITLGAGLMGSCRFGQTRQFCLNQVRSQSAVGLLLGGPFRPYFRICHGCTPLDGIYHTITSMQDDQIYEIDRKPVVDVIDEACGSQTWRQQRPVDAITLGVNCGGRFDPPQESNYINRLITGVLPGDRGIGIFEPDLHEGAEVQFMLRDPEKMIESAQRNSRALIEQVLNDHRTPVCGIYIDCGDRSAALSNTAVEEAALVQDAFNQQGIPLLGFYSGVEIAPLMGKSRGLDWTGVLVLIAEDEG
ncbi:MAG: FIST C-terminal domain-containing protein [Phycisphaerales bacterium]|nr:MAG: FIST C-terminal domain-containing protein [Phycisphaerales bacterium]